jgi:predicted Zn-dependent protease
MGFEKPIRMCNDAVIMNSYKHHNLLKTIGLALCLAITLVWCGPAMAISIKEEEKLAREFMKVMGQRYELVSDPAIVRYVNEIGKKILAVMPVQPFNYRFYVIKEDVYNAFAIPAGQIFIHSGLLAAMESEDELAGIIGHEIAHVVNRHISKRIDRAKKIDLATMAGMVAGIFLGVASGDPSAAQVMTIGSAAAGQTASLAYSREDESQADQYGLQYIVKAGYDPHGLLSALRRIRSKQWFGSEQIPTYMMTHPAVEDRITSIDTWITMNPKQSPAGTSTSGDGKAFQHINTRLRALYGDSETTLDEFEKALALQPDDADLAYGYGLILARVDRRSEAVVYLKKALAKNMLDIDILVDLGRVYFQDGRYQDALTTLQGALTSSTATDPEGLFYLGRTQLALGQFDRAADSLETLIADYPTYQQAYYFLGETYGKLERTGEAHYYLGLFYFNNREFQIARFHLQRAQKTLNDPVKLKAIEEHLQAIGPPTRGDKQ